MITQQRSTCLDEEEIERTLAASCQKDPRRVFDILAKARELKGLDPAEVAVLMGVGDPELVGEVFRTARQVKEQIYGSRLVLFAPLYISNLCSNDCVYCAFRDRNRALTRRALTQKRSRAT